MSTDYIVILITTSSRTEADKIADMLLAERQAACINIVPGVTSRYWWQGKRESADECLLLVKTEAAALTGVIRLVKSIHSYTVPEIIALPVIGGNSDYLSWIGEEVHAGTG